MKRLLPALLALMLLITMAVAYLLFLPSYIHFDMPCMEMTSEGTEVQEGRLSLSGLLYRDLLEADTNFIVFDFQFPGLYGYESVDQGYVVTQYMPLCLSGFPLYNEETFNFKGCLAVWHKDGNFCVVYVDGKIFVGSVSGNYADAFAQCDSVVYIGD